MDKALCEYCGNWHEGDECHSCGGNHRDRTIRNQIRETKWKPYFYNGYIVWPSSVDDFESVLRYHFYLGDTLVETIQFPRNFLHRIEGHNDFRFDLRAFVWRLFLVAQKEEEVLRITERNTMPPATFEIRRVEPEKLTKDEAEQYWIERYQ